MAWHAARHFYAGGADWGGEGRETPPAVARRPDVRCSVTDALMEGCNGTVQGASTDAPFEGGVVPATA